VSRSTLAQKHVFQLFSAARLHGRQASHQRTISRGPSRLEEDEERMVLMAVGICLKAVYLLLRSSTPRVNNTAVLHKRKPGP